MKGFIHIVEIVIVAMVMFLVLFRFSQIPLPEYGISGTKIKLMGNDALFSLDAKGIDWLNKSMVEESLETIFNETGAVFSLELRNVIKPFIRVGCICSPDELSSIRGALKSFTINNRETEFMVEEISTENPGFSLKYDLIIVGNYSLEPFSSRISGFLGAGRGIIEIRGFSDETELGSVQQNFFGLEWDSGTSGSGPVEFSSHAQNPESGFYNIYKYFYHIPNSSGSLPEKPHLFLNFTAQHIAQKEGRSEGVVLQHASGAPALVVNEKIVGGRGRAAWLSPAKSNDLKDEDMKILLRAVAAWAAGQSYNIIKNPIAKEKAVLHYYSAVKRPENPMFQPIEIVLTLGYIY